MSVSLQVSLIAAHAANSLSTNGALSSRNVFEIKPKEDKATNVMKKEQYEIKPGLQVFLTNYVLIPRRFHVHKIISKHMKN